MSTGRSEVSILKFGLNRSGYEVGVFFAVVDYSTFGLGMKTTERSSASYNDDDAL